MFIHKLSRQVGDCLIPDYIFKAHQSAAAFHPRRCIMHLQRERTFILTLLLVR